MRGCLYVHTYIHGVHAFVQLGRVFGSCHVEATAPPGLLAGEEDGDGEAAMGLLCELSERARLSTAACLPARAKSSRREAGPTSRLIRFFCLSIRHIRTCYTVRPVSKSTAPTHTPYTSMKRPSSPSLPPVETHVAATAAGTGE